MGFHPFLSQTRAYFTGISPYAFATSHVTLYQVYCGLLLFPHHHNIISDLTVASPPFFLFFFTSSYVIPMSPFIFKCAQKKEKKYKKIFHFVKHETKIHCSYTGTPGLLKYVYNCLLHCLKLVIVFFTMI